MADHLLGFNDNIEKLQLEKVKINASLRGRNNLINQTFNIQVIRTPNEFPEKSMDPSELKNVPLGFNIKFL